jgi:prepilin-type N-terminal cleavage/methylation domain-containing protein
MNSPIGSRKQKQISKFPNLQISKSPGFTLVEMLVVVAIIGIIAGLITAAALQARIAAKNAAISLELHQLEMACQAYKEKFGEYPPDFFGVNIPGAPGDPYRAAVLRHLAKAFPRYLPGTLGTPGDPSDDGQWAGFVADVLAGWGIDITSAQYQRTPFNALTFWLGGRFDTNAKLFTGFSANPASPFDSSPSRVKPFFEFDVNRVGADGRYWPKDAFLSNTSPGAIVYFRAENSRYDGKIATDIDTQDVYPAVEDRSEPTMLVYVNPKTFQIFSSGLDGQYTRPMPYDKLYTTSPHIGPYIYPSGLNYDPDGHTFDDITNFSGGTLGSKIP